jgi:prepilin-type N-terminal cleavage/methylation domain-containing protein
MKSLRGFSLVEMLIVVTILTIISAITISAFYRFREETMLDRTATQVKSFLTKARQQTLTAKNGYAYGIRFNEQQIFLYHGSFSSSSPDLILNLDPLVAMASSSFSGNTNDVRFIKFTGEPTATGTINVTLDSDTTRYRTITVYQSGLTD